jgi:hypothetical protein
MHRVPGFHSRMAALKAVSKFALDAQLNQHRACGGFWKRNPSAGWPYLEELPPIRARPEHSPKAARSSHAAQWYLEGAMMGHRGFRISGFY